MDDQHAHAGYDGYSTGSFQTDPLFGALPDTESHYGAGHSGQYDSTQWDTTGGQAQSYDAYGTQQYDTTGTWATTGYQTTTDIPAQSTGQWDSNAWNQTGQFGTGSYETGPYENGQYETGQYETAQFTQAADTTGHWNTAPGYDTGAYDTTAWNTGHTDHTAPTTSHTGAYATIPPQQQVSYETAEFPAVDLVETPAVYEATHDTAHDTQVTHDTPDAYEQPYGHAYEPEPEPYDTPEAQPGDEPEDEPAGHEGELASATPVASVSVGPRSARRSASRSRRRTPAKRSALFTVAVPSACVMGVAGIAAASVSGVGTGAPEEKKGTATTASAADPGSVKPVAVNNKLDTQLANLSADADDFADRASRTQERIDLRARQAAEKKRKAEEAARKEAARPKFALPVEQEGLSAYYGQAGVNWMSVHSGIDFPVSYGTPVMASTDGTVRTQYNTAYGNMAIVTAADGTETWYCHLSSTKVRSGSVQAGDVIAYSGNSGNSTGPHLHFEVRPGGDSAVDPLPWLRSHSLSPT
ncbi:M23 family metallopeptidase [Streptomyces spiramyceticus]|uniref:M23 family metallopeptidase n=1 Tax=Streptomyces spiramyceticus TaxID=299717 RepID=UPI00237BA440|nr:peptidoglycan DD-metalloendopeptidase family protein [Streptomyces spiramyceticus]